MADSQKPIARILVIDDEQDIATTIRRGLQMNNFEASSFSDPQEALDHLREYPNLYCLVLSDIRMPAVSGFQVAREVREINPNVKIVLMTAFDISRHEFSKVLPSTPVDDLISKVVPIRELRHVILKHIGNNKRLVDSANTR